MNDPFTADGQITEDQETTISADAGFYDVDRAHDDHSSGTLGDTFVRNDKYRIADPNSYKSHNDIDYEQTNDENQNFGAANTDNCVHA